MDAIDILMDEHKHIKKVVEAIKKDCEILAEGESVNTEFYRQVIDFVRNYADKYHHQKEEKRLFNIMSDANAALKSGPITGMLLEHDMGRAYIKNLNQAVDEYEKGNKRKKAYIISNALSYAILLESHIEKEDTAIYMTARRVLTSELLENMTSDFVNIEKSGDNIKLKEKYISFADRL